MDGIHDLGGMHGFGPIPLEDKEPVFHHDWEGRMYALNIIGLTFGKWRLDELRHAIERMPPDAYLNVGYYQKWVAGLERMLAEKEVLTTAEIDARMTELAGEPQ